MNDVVKKIYLKYAFVFNTLEDYLRLVKGVNQDFLSVDNAFYFQLALEFQVRTYLEKDFQKDNYRIIHSYINQETLGLLKDCYIEFLNSIELLLKMGNVLGSDNLAKRLVEDNINLLNVCGKIIQEYKYFFVSGNVSKLNLSAFSLKILYSYCDLMGIDFSNQEDSSLYQEAILPPFLDEKDEKETILKAQNNDQEATEEVICRFIRMVYKEANKYKSNFNDFDDLVNQGIIGIIYGIRNFDVDAGVRFSSYVSPWIRMSILRYLERNSGCIRVSDNYRRLYRRYKETIDTLYSELEREPSFKEVALRLKVEPRVLMNIINLMDLRICLDAPINETEGFDDSLIGSILDETVNIEDDYDIKSNKVLIRKMVDECNLTVKERQVLLLRFGFQTGYPLSRPEIARIMNISSERVRQLEATGLERLQKTKTFKEYDADNDNNFFDIMPNKKSRKLKITPERKK